MSGSAWFTTVGTTMVDQVSCIAFEVMSSNGDENKKDVALGVSFAVAFVVGCLFALVAAVLIFRYIARKDKVLSSAPSDESRDVENRDDKSATTSYRRLKRESEPSNVNEDWRAELQQFGTHVPTELQVSLHLILQSDRSNVELPHFLSLPSAADYEVEFLRLNMLEVSDLERMLIEERINAKMLCIREILAVQLKRNRLTKAQFNGTLRKVFSCMYEVVSSAQCEMEVGREELKKKLLKDAHFIEIEMMKIYLRSLGRVTVAVQNADRVFCNSLAESSNLTADEVKVIAENLLDSTAGLESRLNDERIRQSIFIERGKTKRKSLAETLELYEESLSAEISGRQNAISHVLQSLNSERTISDKTKTELQDYLTQKLKSIHFRFSQDFQQIKLNRAEPLKQAYQEKLSRLTAEHQNHRSQFFATLDKMSADNGLAQTYLEMWSQARRQKNQLEDELNQDDGEAVENINKEFERVWQKCLAEFDQQLKTSLRSQGRLVEQDADGACRLYQAQLQQEQRMINMETRERLRQIHEKLPSKDQMEETALRRLRSEEQELRIKLEKFLHGIFRTQTLLTPEAKKIVQKRHEQKMIGVTNQLLMANRRCQKILIWLYGVRRRWTEEYSQKKEEQTMVDKDKKTKKSSEKMKSQKVEELQRLDKLAADMEESLRVQAKKTEEEILKNHDSFLAELIGCQVAAEARKQALTNVRKDTTISKLEDRVINKIESRFVQGETLDGYLDVISQQHLTEVSELIEEMRLARMRRDELIVQKIESRQHTKEREIASDLNQQARNQWNENKNIIVEHFEHIAFQQLFKDSRTDLKLDCTMEIERLRQEVSVELENELHQQLMEQKKIFLAQVIALTKMTKDVIEEIITGAVREAGGDDKQASKLLKEFLLEVQKAKINSGFDHRLPSKTKSSDSLLSSPPPTSTKNQRSKTDLGLTYPLSSQDVMERPKARFQAYQGQSYLDSDDETSSMDQLSLPQRPRNAFKLSAEV